MAQTSRTQAQILDAVLEVVADDGLNGLSVEAVAAHAGVSRQTVYRHFDNRPRLIEETILREERGFIEQMLLASEEARTLHEAVRSAVVVALKLARDHPVLMRLLDREPDSLLPYLLLGRGPVVSAAEPAVEDLLRQYRPELPRPRLRLTADLATRLLVSYVVSPDREVGDDELATVMADLVVNLVDR